MKLLHLRVISQVSLSEAAHCHVVHNFHIMKVLVAVFSFARNLMFTFFSVFLLSMIMAA
jgi:hypothetical protein